jgi:acetoin utilization deacetylase AcuC-like enzyme
MGKLCRLIRYCFRHIAGFDLRPTMLILHDPATLLHIIVEFLGARLIPAKECPQRITAILEALVKSRFSVRNLSYEDGKSGSNWQVLLDILRDSHDAGYLQHLETAHSAWVSNGSIDVDETVLPECFPLKGLFKDGRQSVRLSQPPKDPFARAGFYAFDMSAGIGQHTWISALASANLAVEGASIISQYELSNEAGTVLALCRPPGHHCTTSISGGYCYLNNTAVAVEAIRIFAYHEDIKTTETATFAILDIDFHHGNGTQEYFYKDPSVLYVSIHGEDEYPYYSGFENEVGAGEGKGFNLNLPLPVDSPIEKYLEKLAIAMERIEKERPRFLIVSLGFDTFNLDPLGSFKLFTEDYETIAARIRATKLVRSIPTLILLEGGYVVERLGDNMVSFLKGWERHL